MKKRVVKDKIWLVNTAVGLALLIGIVIIIGLIHESYRIRKFKVDVFILSYESDICEADGPDGRVKMNDENLPAIYALVQKAKGRMHVGDAQVMDTVVFNYDCHDENWTMTVDKISEDKLRIYLEGPREYTMYLRNKQSFEEFQRAASVNGYKTKNKPLPGAAKK